MRQFKTFAIALAVMVGTTAFANFEPIGSKNKNVTPNEIKGFFKNNSLIYHKELYGKIIFSLNKNREIVVHSVATEDGFFRKYVVKRMEGKVLESREWEIGEFYTLPLRIQLTE